jgi:hypothetical protein
MTNNILLILIILSFIGFLMACLATDVSFAAPIAHVEIPTSEIEITFIPVK